MTIFVSLASYIDEELFFTLKDCIQKAKFPNNIFFGVVDQNINSQKNFVDELEFSKQVRYVYVDYLETFGVCWARNIAFSLYNSEDFLLQIDSHTLFEQDWDEQLISLYNQLKDKSPKPIISTYPYGFTFDENHIPQHKPQLNKTALCLKVHPDTTLSQESCILRFRAEHIFSKEPINGYHLAGGFIFTSGKFIDEVPYDPFLYFHGEEQSLAIRAYTRGWDIYHPVHIPLYHLYKKANTEYTNHHWHKDTEKKRVLNYAHLKQRAIKRLNKIFYGDGMKESHYGLGNIRSLDEFIDFSGIDYKNKLIIKKK
ncbi:GlcNAc-transferase family protein [Arcobacter sp. FWKO B]|uniref:GlcNAc-transferase family protein n=1 Tax=Arcobacter sp. FWKO B TaxID=2593672 RepID=UPI0018A557A1|nr:GlcNAc-transferase family protein [Arcobacter sp. FWKO B]QOG11631.1 hypothetical protein FWKOB_02465 [Arcobacter sp. FWKO B]